MVVFTSTENEAPHSQRKKSWRNRLGSFKERSLSFTKRSSSVFSCFTPIVVEEDTGLGTPPSTKPNNFLKYVNNQNQINQQQLVQQYKQNQQQQQQESKSEQKVKESQQYDSFSQLDSLSLNEHEIQYNCNRVNSLQVDQILTSNIGSQQQQQQKQLKDGVLQEIKSAEEEFKDEDDMDNGWFDAQSNFDEEQCSQELPQIQFSLIDFDNENRFSQQLREQLSSEYSPFAADQITEEIREKLERGQIKQAMTIWTRTQQQVKQLGKMPVCATLKGWLSDVDKGLRELNDYKDYVKAWDHDLVIHYRHRRGNPLHSFKTYAYFPVNPTEFSSLLREFDLVQTWSHYVPESTILQMRAEFHSYILVSLWFPWPFKNRQLVYEATLFDLLNEEGCILLTMKSIQKQKWSQIEGFPKEAWSRVTIDVMEGSCVKVVPRIKNGKMTGVDVTTQLHMNPHSVEIPRFIISFILTIMAPVLYKVAVNIVDQQLTRGQGVYIQRMQKRKHLYDYIRSRLNQYVQQQQQMPN